jgi:uncharacterized membrane protein
MKKVIVLHVIWFVGLVSLVAYSVGGYAHMFELLK